MAIINSMINGTISFNYCISLRKLFDVDRRVACAQPTVYCAMAAFTERNLFSENYSNLIFVADFPDRDDETNTHTHTLDARTRMHQTAAHRLQITHVGAKIFESSFLLAAGARGMDVQLLFCRRRGGYCCWFYS